jgi:hypothetical protein
VLGYVTVLILFVCSTLDTEAQNQTSPNGVSRVSPTKEPKQPRFPILFESSGDDPSEYGRFDIESEDPDIPPLALFHGPRCTKHSVPPAADPFPSLAEAIKGKAKEKE